MFYKLNNTNLHTSLLIIMFSNSFITRLHDCIALDKPYTRRFSSARLLALCPAVRPTSTRRTSSVILTIKLHKSFVYGAYKFHEQYLKKDKILCFAMLV